MNHIKTEPMPVPDRHPDALFPDAISSVGLRVRETAAACVYDHRPYLHPCDTDIVAKLSDQFRSGYAAVKWAVARVVRPRTICEIGVAGGLSALAMLDACPDAAFLGIDNGRYEDDFGVPLLSHVQDQFSVLGRHGRIMRADSRTLKELPGDFDLLHVDGNHGYDYCRHDVGLGLRSGVPWILVDDARDSQVAAGALAALLAHRVGPWEWTVFEDTWTGSMLIYTGKGAR